MVKTLLLISERPEDLEFAKIVADASGLSLLTAPNPVAGAQALEREGAAAVFIDATTDMLYQAFETAIQNSVGLFSDRISSTSIHFISDDELEKTPYIVQSPLFGNFVMRRFSDPREAGTQYGRVMAAILDKRAFGLQRLFDPSTKIQVIRLANSNQKPEAIEAVRSYLVAAKFQSRVAAVIANAVDEILLNAIYDAPIDDVGRPIYKLTSRASSLTLSGKNAIEMHVGFDGKHVAVSTIDLFGSLDKGNLLSSIARSHQTDEYKVKGTAAHAGIGLATVYRTGGSLFFVSESRTRTEVTVFFKRTENFREFKEQFRFVSTQFYF